MVKALNVNSLNRNRDRNRNVKFISRFSTKTSSTLFTQKPNLNKFNGISNLTNLNYYGFCSMLPCFSINGMFVINGTRAFHNSAVLLFKKPNFIKNLFSKNNGPSISASTSTTSSTSDIDSETEFKPINLWIAVVGLFSDKLADRMAYNRINKKRVNEWRNDVAEAQENNQSNSNNNSNSNINNVNNNNIISTDTNNIKSHNNNSNNNNNNNNNVNFHNDYSSDSNDSGGDLGD